MNQILWVGLRYKSSVFQVIKSCCGKVTVVTFKVKITVKNNQEDFWLPRCTPETVLIVWIKYIISSSVSSVFTFKIILWYSVVDIIRQKCTAVCHPYMNGMFLFCVSLFYVFLSGSMCKWKSKDPRADPCGTIWENLCLCRFKTS